LARVGSGAAGGVLRRWGARHPRAQVGRRSQADLPDDGGVFLNRWCPAGRHAAEVGRWGQFPRLGLHVAGGVAGGGGGGGRGVVPREAAAFGGSAARWLGGVARGRTRRMRRRKPGMPGVGPEMKLLLSVDEAAAVMSLGRSLVYDLVMQHQIASIKVGRMRRI